MPPGTGKVTAAPESREPEQDTKDRCEDYYVRCVEAGGGNMNGHAAGYSRCASCMAYCTSNGFWPEAIYTWNGVRLSCPGI
jgi:hypothetical protein